jgi:predicted methyltransferase
LDRARGPLLREEEAVGRGVRTLMHNGCAGHAGTF